MSVKQFIPAVKYGNAVTSDEVDLSGATGDVTFTAGNPVTSTQSVSALNPAIGQSVTVSLSAAQIAAMSVTPVTAIAAPGTGKAIVVDNVLFAMTPTTTSFTGGGVFGLYYSGTSVTLAGTFPLSLITSGVAGVANLYYQVGAANTTASLNLVNYQANTAVVVTNQTAAFATGTGTAKMYINYQVITL